MAGDIEEISSGPANAPCGTPALPPGRSLPATAPVQALS
jgi:hypothetical protein